MFRHKSSRRKVRERGVEKRPKLKHRFLLCAALCSQLNKLSGVFHFFFAAASACKDIRMDGPCDGEVHRAGNREIAIKKGNFFSFHSIEA